MRGGRSASQVSPVGEPAEQTARNKAELQCGEMQSCKTELVHRLTGALGQREGQIGTEGGIE